MTELTGRSPMKSLGAPSLRCDVERAFWRRIAEGLAGVDAALAVGASPAAGIRWFRQRGGMATFMLDAVSCRYLCFEQREEIALLRAQGAGVREIARQLDRSPSTSRVSCGATRRLVAASSSTGRRSRSGRRS
jgi:hypothetical protein